MKNYTDTNSHSPPPGGTVAQAPQGTGHDTTPPALTSGFGAVIEREEDLRTATEGSFGQASGHHSADLDRILHHQHSRLGANIAMLERRYEDLPKPERFVKWHDAGRPPAKPRHTARDESEVLPDLIARHTRLLRDIEALIGCRADGQRGERLLAEVSRNHEEMAWMLTALLNDDDSARRTSLDPSIESSDGSRRAQENWDNEGGPARVDPPSR